VTLPLELAQALVQKACTAVGLDGLRVLAVVVPMLHDLLDALASLDGRALFARFSLLFAFTNSIAISTS